MLLGYPLRQDLPSIYGTWIPFRKQNRCPATCLQRETNRNRWGRLSANMFCSAIKLSLRVIPLQNLQRRQQLCRETTSPEITRQTASQSFAYNCASESSKRLKQLSWFIHVYTLLFVIQMSSKCSFKIPNIWSQDFKRSITPYLGLCRTGFCSTPAAARQRSRKKNVEFGK